MMQKEEIFCHHIQITQHDTIVTCAKLNNVK